MFCDSYNKETTEIVFAIMREMEQFAILYDTKQDILYGTALNFIGVEICKRFIGERPLTPLDVKTMLQELGKELEAAVTLANRPKDLKLN